MFTTALFTAAEAWKYLKNLLDESSLVVDSSQAQGGLTQAALWEKRTQGPISLNTLRDQKQGSHGHLRSGPGVRVLKAGPEKKGG